MEVTAAFSGSGPSTSKAWVAGMRRLSVASGSGYQQLTPTTVPTVAPAAAPTPAASKELDDKQQHDRADRGVGDRGDEPGTEIQAQLRHQPVTDERADDSNNHVANKPKPCPVDELPSQPPR